MTTHQPSSTRDSRQRPEEIAPGGRPLKEHNRAMSAHLGGLVMLWSVLAIAPLIVVLL
jgi:hypothetical protein